MMDSRSKAKNILSIAKEAQNMLREIQVMSIHNEVDSPKQEESSLRVKPPIIGAKSSIYYALLKLSPTLAYSYEQVRRDISDAGRISWAGTAHEVREILGHLLRSLAPDEDVKKEPWFKQDPSAKGITQAQRAKFILHKRKRGSSTREVVEKDVILLDDRISELVRSTYSRASDAAHTYENKQEVILILRYFDALVHDLIEVEPDYPTVHFTHIS